MKKLSLKTETLQTLSGDSADQIGGGLKLSGFDCPSYYCHITNKFTNCVSQRCIP